MRPVGLSEKGKSGVGTPLLWRHEGFDPMPPAVHGELALERPGLGDTAFRIVDETKHDFAVALRRIPLDVHADLVSQALGVEARLGLLDHDDDALALEPEVSPDGSVLVTRRPV